MVSDALIPLLDTHLSSGLPHGLRLRVHRCVWDFVTVHDISRMAVYTTDEHGSPVDFYLCEFVFIGGCLRRFRSEA